MTAPLDAARAALLTGTGWFDPDWYAARAPVPLGPGDDPLAHYLEHGAPAGLAPGPWLADLQDPPPLDGGLPDPLTGHPLPPEDDPRLRLEMAVVAASGRFDPDFYRAQNPPLVPEGVDPLLHFCRTGWRHLLAPHAGFDLWWTWVNHLDPAREAVNPFVHHLLVGDAAGWSTRPTDPTTRVEQRLPEDGVRRACLFAAYDPDGLVDDATLDYVRELARFADVYYLADGWVEPTELARLDGITAGAWGVRHGAYDFGSYSLLARELVGWETLSTYDEVLLVNDSCYLLTPLDEVFEEMSARPCAWWGLQATKGLAATRARAERDVPAPVPMDRVRAELLADFEQDPLYDFHVGSYFLALRRPVLTDPRFRRLLETVHAQRGKLAIVQKYEIGFTHYLVGHGYGVDTWLPTLYPFHPLFTAWYFELLECGFPLLKKYLLYQNHYDVPGLAQWPDLVRAVVPDAPVETFERNLVRTAPHDRLVRSLAITAGPDGAPVVPEVLRGRAFRRLAARTPAFEHWWAFPVSADRQVLPESSRAILAEVLDDPSITKVVLTGRHAVDVRGESVVVAPRDSPEGQQALVRCRHVFVDEQPSATLRVPLDPDRQLIHLLGDGLVVDGAGRAGVPSGSTREVELRPFAGRLVASSAVDQLAALATHYPARYADAARTGRPELDLLLMPEDRLPADLRDQHDRLQDQLAGRRLVLLAPTRGRSVAGTAYPFGPPEVARLADWARGHDLVLGLREHPADAERAYRRMLHEITLDLTARHQPSLPVLLRSADVVVTDFSGTALLQLATGRPLVSFVHDLPSVRDRLLLDLDHVLPDPPTTSVDELLAALEGAVAAASGVSVDVEEAARRRRRSQDLFFDVIDDRNAWRLVHDLRLEAAAVDA